MYKKNMKVVVAIFALAMASPSWADRITEQEQLTRLSKELGLVASFVQRMQDSNSGDGDGLVFRYDLLEKEIKGIQQGISDHLRMLEKTPRFARIQQLPTE